VRDDDTVVEAGDLKVLVDPRSAPHLTGSSVDFIEDQRGSGFTVDNPNAPVSSGCSSHGCSGCG
jgi:iron-sulfur cluster assembly accessory protein